MAYSLPPDLEQFIEEELAEGKYANENELICEAVRALRTRERQLNQLRAQIAPAAARLGRGEGIVLSNEKELEEFFDSVRHRGRERLGRDESL